MRSTPAVRPEAPPAGGRSAAPTETSLDAVRMRALLDRLDPVAGGVCSVPGCVHRLHSSLGLRAACAGTA
jgi:hypothetical protein